MAYSLKNIAILSAKGATVRCLLMKKWCKNSGKEFDQLKNIDAKFYASDYYDKKLNIYKFKTQTLLRFWENKGWINEIGPYGWFQWYFRHWLGRRSKDDKKQINRWKKL